MLSHVIYYLGKTENDTDKSPNIVKYYEIARKLFTAEYIFVREKVRENTVSKLFPVIRYDIQKQRIQSR